MPRRLLPLLALALVAASPAAAQTPAPHGHAAASADPTMGVHGMLVFGDSAVYLSHLPLYRAPHDWQVILRATVASDAATSVPDALAAYRADRAASGERVYTLEPERFPLSRLTELRPGETFRFTGTLYRGHFERGGTPIVTGAVFEVSRVVARHLPWKLPAGHFYPTRDVWTLFGAPGEAFLAHSIGEGPDFDQVVRVTSPQGLPAGDLAGPVQVWASRREFAPMAEGEAFSAHRLTHIGGPPLRMTVTERIYLEFGDLARP